MGCIPRDLVVCFPFPRSGSLTKIIRAGSGFKLNIESMKSLKLNLGSHTTSPLTSVGVSVNYGPYTTVNVSEGSNVIPLDGSTGRGNSVVRITTEGWQNNRMQLESIVLNEVCSPSLPQEKRHSKKITGGTSKAV